MLRLTGQVVRGSGSGGVIIRRCTAVLGEADVRVPQQIVFVIQNRALPAHKQNCLVIPQQPHLIRLEQFASACLPVHAVAAVAAAASVVGRDRDRFLADQLRNILVRALLVAAQVQKFVAQTDQRLPVVFVHGFAATKKVDPNLVIKKKDGKDQEVQEGWVGHIIPFDLVQATLLSAETDELHGLESRLAEIPSEYESILDEMTEEDKESCNDVLTEEGDAFVPKEVSKKIKELKKDRSPESVALRTLLEKVESLIKSEKEIKAEIKAKSAALQAKTKDTIESLSDEQALDLLEKKWIAPLIESIHKLPDTVIDSLVSQIQALQNKYATTFFEVEQQISETEATLSGMIDDLEGNEYDMLGLNELKKLLGGSAE